jgi:hypothetical protein
MFPTGGFLCQNKFCSFCSFPLDKIHGVGFTWFCEVNITAYGGVAMTIYAPNRSFQRYIAPKEEIEKWWAAHKDMNWCPVQGCYRLPRAKNLKESLDKMQVGVQADYVENVVKESGREVPIVPNPDVPSPQPITQNN